MTKQKIILDSDGNSIWLDPAEKLRKIASSIKVKMDDIRNKYIENENAIKPKKLNYTLLINQILTFEFHRFPQVRRDYAQSIDVDTLKGYINCYFELLDYILWCYPDFLSTKALFCLFVGVAPIVYNDWLFSNDPDISVEMQFLETHLQDVTLLSSQTGLAKEKSAENRLKAGGIGHNLQLKNDNEGQQTTINLVSYDAESLQHQIAKMGLTVTKKSTKN